MNVDEITQGRAHNLTVNNKLLTWTRYGNANEFAWAIVAVSTLDKNGDLILWSAYMGGNDLVNREFDCVEWVAAKGNKLLRADAEYFFPYLPIERYRQ